MIQIKNKLFLKNYSNYFLKNKIEIIILSLFISIIYSLFSSNYLILLIILLIPLSTIFLSEKAFILISIVIFISLIGESIQEYRNYFTILSTTILLIFFIKRYGLNINYFPRPPIPFALLLIILLISVSLSTLLTGLNNASIDAVYRTVIFFSICYLIYAFLEEKQSLENVYLLTISLFIANIILSITVYYDLFKSGFLIFIFDILITRWGGAIGNPNTLALVISINIILLVVLIFSEKISKKIKISLLPILLLNNIIVLILTNSRAAIMGLSLSLLFLFYILNKKVLNYIFLFVVTLLLLYLFEPFSRSLIDLYLRLETVSQRHYLWQAGIDIMKDYPIIGVGPEVYPDKFYSYLPTSASYFFNLIYIVQKPHPHNYSLWLITEMGILGWISSISIFGIYFYMAGKLLYARKKNKDELYLFSLGLFAVGILVFVRSFFEVEGVFSYGYISRDLSFWISYIILAFLYKNQNTISAHKK